MSDAPVPTHLSLILDGNRRWAKERGLPTLEGHRKGYGILKDITKAAFDRGISFVSAFIFSTENWNRTEKEVKYLMDLAYRMLSRDIRELDKENIKVVWLGTREKLNKKLLKAIDEAVERTKHNTRGTLALCFNYGGTHEITDAARQLVARGLSPHEITQEVFEGALYAPEVPAVDLLVRTSGERRLSGYMLYRAAYAELHFITKHWPDFTEADLDDALREYAKRNRRHGGNGPTT